jgi:hypothetical protein
MAYVVSMESAISFSSLQVSETRNLSRQGSPVHIFLRADGFGDDALPISADVVSQGELDKDPTDGVIVVEFLYDFNDFIYSSFCG